MEKNDVYIYLSFRTQTESLRTKFRNGVKNLKLSVYRGFSFVGMKKMIDLEILKDSLFTAILPQEIPEQVSESNR